MRSLLTTAFTCAVLSHAALAAGQYLEKGRSGIVSGLEFAMQEESTGFGGALAYSHLGLADVLVHYSRTLFETEASGPFPTLEYGGNTFGIGLMGHPLKESASIPVSLSLEAGYAHLSIGGGDLDGAAPDGGDLDGSANILSLGATLHRTLPLGGAFAVLFGAGYTWSRASFEMGGFEDDDTMDQFPLHLEGIIKAGAGKVVVGPSYTLSEEANVLGLELSYVHVLP